MQLILALLLPDISPDRQVSDLTVLIQGRSPIPEPGNSRQGCNAATPSRYPTFPTNFGLLGEAQSPLLNLSGTRAEEKQPDD